MTETEIMKVIIVILLIIIIVLLYIVFKLYPIEPRINSKNSNHVSRDQFNETLKNLNSEIGTRNEYKKKYIDLKNENAELNVKYFQKDESFKDACLEINKLKAQIEEIKRENNELNKLLGKDSTMNGAMAELKDEGVNKVKETSYQSSIQNIYPNETLKDTQRYTETNRVACNIMYASFPRTNGSTKYFTDLTASLVEDSYFELMISSNTNKASFKPLEFMKIRNSDTVMVAIVTEGVKPHSATTILGIEPGEAHKDKVWIIDKPAKIKLA